MARNNAVRKEVNTSIEVSKFVDVSRLGSKPGVDDYDWSLTVIQVGGAWSRVGGASRSE